MVISANLGFPRIGAKRELKKAVESYWKGNISENELNDIAKEIRKNNWEFQKQSGIDLIPSNDFSYYDQILDMIALTGATPKRYNAQDNLESYFSMARGAQKDGVDLKAMEMTKWFDTNYHYIVPEFYKGQSFKISSNKVFDHYLEAKDLGIETRPVLVGPLTFLIIGKTHDENFDQIDLVDKLVDVYIDILEKLSSIGVKEVQIDEPALVLDLTDKQKQAYKDAYAKISKANIKIALTTYFDDLEDNMDLATSLGTDSIHIDLVRAESQIDRIKLSGDTKISLGLVDGRNIWKNDFERSINIAKNAIAKFGEDKVIIASSCSLLHSPIDLDIETDLNPEIKNWLSFAKQKVKEIVTITKAINGDSSVNSELEENKKANDIRKTSKLIHDDEVKNRVNNISESDLNRDSNFNERISLQRKSLNLPPLPTTTIGSFPQTQEVRKYRAEFKKSAISEDEYNKFLREETVSCIRKQEELDIDVLVHGEFERNDMVEYFGEQLSGFTFTKFGWVQSYGSRCVKPPIIFGDVKRPKAMTVEWSKFAQDNTERVMKGMLTGPVTILQWSFVRNDQPRSTTCNQIAFAIRDEVKDLEDAGIKVIQIDEAALREGLPLRKKNWADYLKWSVDAFRITASVAKNETQIHTHMCYSEFNDIIEAVARMDADVISIETSRSQMELLDAFVNFKYPNEIGPGVYDIHSPRVPNQEEMENLMKKALDVLSADQLWVNPDCGLKTRGWKEVEPALDAMVKAAKSLRQNLESSNKATA